MTATEIVCARALETMRQGKQIDFADGFVISTDVTLDDLRYWFNIENQPLEAAVEELAGSCLTILECVELFKTGTYPRSIMYKLINAIQTGTLVVMYPTNEYHELRDLIMEAV